jgi:hypothetical protein
MLNAIRFLEQVGREQMSSDQYVAAVTCLDVSEQQRHALATFDQTALVKLLSAPTSMFFGVFAPEEMPDEEMPARELPEEPTDEPEQQD